MSDGPACHGSLCSAGVNRSVPSRQVKQIPEGCQLQLEFVPNAVQKASASRGAVSQPV